MAGEAAPRLFIVEFDLADRSSHFFNQVLGFKLAAEQRGRQHRAQHPYRERPADGAREHGAGRRHPALAPLHAGLHRDQERRVGEAEPDAVERAQGLRHVDARARPQKRR